MNKPPEFNKLVHNWLVFAKENLLYARDGMKADYSPYHTICYLCQGSAEKYLKAYLISRGWELEKVHDLKRLLRHAIEYDQSFDRLFAQVDILNEYITEGRYPGDLPFESIGEKDAIEAIESAEVLAEFVLTKIDLSDDTPSNESETED